MKTTKIDWCDCTVNPVVGCSRGCEYCFARKLNDRFGWVPDFAKPQFFPERLKQFDSKTPESVFIDSMSDIAEWKVTWLEEVLRAMDKNPQHTYIALTKNPAPKGLGYACRSDRTYWLGATVDTQSRLDALNGFFFEFLSIEPILEPIDLGNILSATRSLVCQVIIGAETGSRRGKVTPDANWVRAIVAKCDERGVRVFMKSSLRDIMGDEFRQDPLVWDVYSKGWTK